MATIKTRSSAGSIPAPIIPPSISGTVAQGQVLTCNDGVWAGLKPVTFARQWYRGASTVLAGQTGATYTVVIGDAGSTLRCAVTATNPLGPVTVSTPNTIVVP